MFKNLQNNSTTSDLDSLTSSSATISNLIAGAFYADTASSFDLTATNATLANLFSPNIRGTTADISNQLIIPNGTGSIGGSNITNASLLVGTVALGIGIDQNELYKSGNSDFLIGTIDPLASLSIRIGGNERFLFNDTDSEHLVPLKINDSTDATNTSSGSFISRGGCAIQKDLFVGGNANVNTRLVIPTPLTSIAATHITNGNLLIGTGASGIGFDFNEILRKGPGSFIVGTIDNSTTFEIMTGATSRFITSTTNITSTLPLTIFDSTNASNSTTGGAFTSFGGGAFEKDVYIGAGITALSGTIGSVVVTGNANIPNGTIGNLTSTTSTIGGLRATSITTANMTVTGNTNVNTRLVIPTSLTSIAATHITNGNLLIGTGASGIGFDFNEILRKGPGSFVVGTIDNSTTFEIMTGALSRLVTSTTNITASLPLTISDSTNASNATTGGAFTSRGGGAVEKDFYIGGALSKSSGTFDIPHPCKDGYRLRHSFVESPNRGDNIYRYQIEVDKQKYKIDMPDYFPHLNENVQVFISPVGHYGTGYAEYKENQNSVVVRCNETGTYNVLIIGTRKDKDAKSGWDAKGLEYQG